MVMKNARFGRFAGIWLGVVGVVPAAGAGVIYDLGTVNGGGWFAQALSDDGSTVVGYGGDRAYKWTTAGGLQNLGVLSGGTWSQAYGVNANGSSVVGSGNSTGGFTRAFSHSGSMSDLGAAVFPPGGNSYARASSSTGTVVVGSFEVSGATHAGRWTSTGFQDLGVLQPQTATSSRANAVSPDGNWSVGQSGQLIGGPRAVRWSGSGSILNLGVLSGGTTSEAFAVSSNGMFVAGRSGSSSGNRAFRWTNTGMQDLGVLPGDANSGATDITGDGQTIVGFSAWQFGPSFYHRAIMWKPGLGMVDLNTYLPSIGIPLTGWNLEDAVGISLNGTAIAGYGSRNGELRSFLVTGIPSPGSGTLLILGVLSVVRRRRA